MIDDIKRDMTFSAPLDKVWDAITSTDALKVWFGSDAQVEMRPEAEGFFEWQGEYEGRFACKIIEIRPKHFFAWRWMLEADVPYSDQGSTLVEWTLEALDENRTRVILLESEFATAKHRQMNVEGWQQELTDLEHFLA